MGSGVLTPGPQLSPITQIDSVNQISGLACDYDAASITGLIDADPVVTWPNTSSHGSARDMTGVNGPTYETNELNGYPIVRFVRANLHYFKNTSAFLTGTTGSVFAVIKPSAVPTDNTERTIIGSGDEATATRFCYTTWRNNIVEIVQRDDDVVQASGGTYLVGSTRYRLIEVHSTGTAYGVAIDGVTDTVTARLETNDGDWWGDTSARDNTSVGAVESSAGLFHHMDGDLARLFVYDSVILTSDELRSIRHYIATRYALPIALG